MKKVVLFVDNHSLAGSRITEVSLNQFYGDKYKAYSAGVAEITKEIIDTFGV